MVATDVASRGIGMYHSLPSQTPLSSFQHLYVLCFTLVYRGFLDCANLPDLVSGWSLCVESWVRSVADSLTVLHSCASALVPASLPWYKRRAGIS